MSALIGWYTDGARWVHLAGVTQPLCVRHLAICHYWCIGAHDPCWKVLHTGRRHIRVLHVECVGSGSGGGCGHVVTVTAVGR